MNEYIETIKNNPKTQKDIELIVIKLSNQSYRTQSQIRQKALIQIRIYEHSIEVMGETIADMDKEIEFRQQN